MSFSEAIKTINAAVASSPGSASEDERKEALKACDKLRECLETPFETRLRIMFSALQAMSLRLGVDMKLFDAAAKTSFNGGEVMIAQLSSETGADPLLIMLAGMGIFKQVAEDSFESTPLAAAYVLSSPLWSGVIQVTHFFMVLSKLPDYFEEKGWKNPDDAYDGPFQYALNTKSTYFELLATKPYLQQAFNTVMTLSHRRRGQQWFNSFPIESKLLVHSSSDPLLIDIGGSQGADLISFKERYPDLSGWLILQDLPIVVEQAKNVPFGIEVMGYDFFAPQPIKGAKAYYLRTVLHDWPDQRAVQILQRVREAMGPESLLLINEIVLPETNVALSSALADLTMMVSFSSLERTQKQFEALLNEAGFELVHLRTPDGFESRSAPLAEQASLLEAVPKRP